MLKESPAGTKTLRFIKTVNKDLSVDEKFVATNFTKTLIEKIGGSDKIIVILSKEIAANDGALTVYTVNRPTNFKYEYITKGSKSGWLNLIFHLDNQNPYSIKGFELDGIEKPAGIGEAIEL